MKYNIIECRYSEDLEEQVNKSLENGWELFGHPFMRKSDDGTWSYIAQAMIFEDIEEKPICTQKQANEYVDSMIGEKIQMPAVGAQQSWPSKHEVQMAEIISRTKLYRENRR